MYQAGSAKTLDKDNARVEPTAIDQRESVRTDANFDGRPRDKSRISRARYN